MTGPTSPSSVPSMSSLDGTSGATSSLLAAPAPAPSASTPEVYVLEGVPFAVPPTAQPDTQGNEMVCNLIICNVAKADQASLGADACHSRTLVGPLCAAVDSAAPAVETALELQQKQQQDMVASQNHQMTDLILQLQPNAPAPAPTAPGVPVAIPPSLLTNPQVVDLVAAQHAQLSAVSADNAAAMTSALMTAVSGAITPGTIAAAATPGAPQPAVVDSSSVNAGVSGSQSSSEAAPSPAPVAQPAVVQKAAVVQAQITEEQDRQRAELKASILAAAPQGAPAPEVLAGSPEWTAWQALQVQASDLEAAQAAEAKQVAGLTAPARASVTGKKHHHQHKFTKPSGGTSTTSTTTTSTDGGMLAHSVVNTNIHKTVVATAPGASTTTTTTTTTSSSDAPVTVGGTVSTITATQTAVPVPGAPPKVVTSTVTDSTTAPAAPVKVVNKNVNQIVAPSTVPGAAPAIYTTTSEETTTGAAGTTPASTIVYHNQVITPQVQPGAPGQPPSVTYSVAPATSSEEVPTHLVQHKKQTKTKHHTQPGAPSTTTTTTTTSTEAATTGVSTVTQTVVDATPAGPVPVSSVTAVQPGVPHHKVKHVHQHVKYAPGGSTAPPSVYSTTTTTSDAGAGSDTVVHSNVDLVPTIMPVAGLPPMTVFEAQTSTSTEAVADTTTSSSKSVTTVDVGGTPVPLKSVDVSTTQSYAPDSGKGSVTKTVHKKEHAHMVPGVSSPLVTTTTTTTTSSESGAATEASDIATAKAAAAANTQLLASQQHLETLQLEADLVAGGTPLAAVSTSPQLKALQEQHVAAMNDLKGQQLAAVAQLVSSESNANTEGSGVQGTTSTEGATSSEGTPAMVAAATSSGTQAEDSVAALVAQAQAPGAPSPAVTALDGINSEVVSVAGELDNEAAVRSYASAPMEAPKGVKIQHRNKHKNSHVLPGGELSSTTTTTTTSSSEAAPAPEVLAYVQSEAKQQG